MPLRRPPSLFTTMDDEYIPPFADDPKLLELRAKVAIIRACGKASKDPDDNESLRSLLTACPNAIDLFSADELRRLIQNWRIRRDDFSADREIDFMQFTLDEKIRARIAELNFDKLYRPLMDASPLNVDGHTRTDFLAALFPQGTSALMLDSTSAREGLPWNIEIGEDIGGAWFLPMPVRVEGDDGELIEKTKSSVADWNSATGNFDAESLEVMRDQIISRDIPVRLAMRTDAGTTLVFAINATDESDWRKKVRALRLKIQALGAACRPFRYNWVAPMIHSHFTRLVYFCP